eukprot:4682309-Amphidinium_carterae.1
MEVIARHKHLAWVIVRDFNAEAEIIPEIRALQGMGWQTIHNHRQATSFAPNAVPRTIDFALANAQFLLHVRQPLPR